MTDVASSTNSVSPTPPRACPICALAPVAKIVDAMIVAGEPDRGIVDTLISFGIPRTRARAPIVQAHRTVCRVGSVAITRHAATGAKSKDFAVMVRDRAAEMVESGDLDVTTQHGLTAQQILDSREAKKEDRALMLNIARMLTISGVPNDLIIAGVPYREIESGIDPDDLEMVSS